MSNHTFTLAFVLISLLLNSRMTTSQEVEDETEFDYLKGSDKGPDKWGELHTEWDACKRGEMQSPIDLLNKKVEILPKLGKLKKGYKPSNATVKNRGHDIMLKWIDGGGSMKINGTKYVLQQCHWHSPSEHTINGKRYELEMHLVHLSVDPNVRNNISVTGILYEMGQPDPFLSELKDHIRSIADSDKEINVGMVNPRHVKMGGKNYYRYMGSLTVPPCTEGVIWTINKMVRTVSKEQIELLKIAVHDFAEQNARPLQPLNDREIHLYFPKLFV